MKKIDCKSLENPPKNINDGVCFSNAASLQSEDCNSTLNRLHHKFFPE